MSQLRYDLQVSWEPQQLKAGQMATVTVTATNVEGELASMHLAVPEEGYYESLRKVGDNVFSATQPVPWEASPGVYPVRFYGRDPRGVKGPEVIVRMRVV